MKKTFFTTILFCYSFLLYAEDQTTILDKDSNQWGISWGVRSASVPYVTTENDALANTYLPLFYLETDYFFVRGSEAGLKLVSKPFYDVNLLMRHHFVDMPRHDKNFFSEDSIDMGVQIRFAFKKDYGIDLELLSDPNKRLRANIRGRWYYKKSRYDTESSVQASFKSASYNSYYYGLSSLGYSDIDLGVMLSVRSHLRYYLSSSWYLYGDVELTHLDQASIEAAPIKNDYESAVQVGLGFNQKRRYIKKRGEIPGYVRLAYGVATPSSFSEVLTLKGTLDTYHNDMISLFYGFPLEKNLFKSRVQVYATSGLVRHFDSEVQNSTFEYVAAMKFYYQPKHWLVRFGLATGLSYIDEITYIESSNLEKDGYENKSLLMHYIDLSCDLSLSKILGEKQEKWWFGYGLHHRSGVFEGAKHFGNIKGGSNYHTFYIQYHFNGY